eukprot:UN00416
MTGFMIGTFGQVYAVASSWQGIDEPVLGCFALMILSVGTIGYYNIQKQGFYPKYSILFVTTFVIMATTPVFLVLCVIPPPGEYRVALP